jgi:hypothetical protein
MNTKGESCYPSQETIANEASLGVRAVRVAVKALETKGFVLRAGGRYRGDVTRYATCLPDGRRQEMPPSDKPKAASSDTKGGISMHERRQEMPPSDKPKAASSDTKGGISMHERRQEMPTSKKGGRPEDGLRTESETVAADGRSDSFSRCDQEGDDDVFDCDPASQDEGLLAKLRTLSPAAHAAAAAEWREPGGPEVVRACVEKATLDLDLDETLLAELLQGPVIFSVIYENEIDDGRSEYRQSWRDAVALAAAKKAEGYDIWLFRAVVGRDAQREIEKQDA